MRQDHASRTGALLRSLFHLPRPSHAAHDQKKETITVPRPCAFKIGLNDDRKGPVMERWLAESSKDMPYHAVAELSVLHYEQESMSPVSEEQIRQSQLLSMEGQHDG
jgi:hypothetical protein